MTLGRLIYCQYRATIEKLFTAMKKPIGTASVLILLIAFSVSGCYSITQAAPQVRSTISTMPNTRVSTQTAMPEGTPIPTATGFFTPGGTGSTTCFITTSEPIAFTPDSAQLLMRSSDGVQVYHLPEMQAGLFIQAPGNLNGPTVALSPDGKVLAWTFDDGTIQGVSMEDQSILFNLQSSQQGMLKLEFSANGEHLYSTSHDGSVKMWNMSGSLLATFQPGGELMNIGVSSDELTMATIPSDGPVSLWSLDDFYLIRELGGSGGYDTSDAVFSPDGRYLAADLATGLFLWSLPNGKELLNTASPINSMAVTFSPDGQTLAYSDNDTVVLSSPDGKNVLQKLQGQQIPIYELVFSPDGSLLVTSDGVEKRIWSTTDGQLLAAGKSVCP